MTEPTDDTGADNNDRMLCADVARAAIGQRLFGVVAPPRRIGRFAIARQLGAGGMGSVFAAYDEELDREVAVKLLKGTVDDGARARMLAEARAMARLRHANVVQVYEVGEHGKQLYIAMEFIDGETLRQWQQRPHQSWERVVDAYVQAAQGLAAAHAAGLVHRDFKPHNAIVASPDSDRVEVRVLDFGLALDRTTSLPTVPLHDPTDESLHTTGTVLTLTLTRTVAGTPAYMSPEQIRGDIVDARTDQYALCVALWEALHGEHPIGGKDVTELFERVRAGRRAPAPVPTTPVPRRILAALTRGMSCDPRDRWPNIEALIEAISVESLRRRKRRWLAVAGVAALVATAPAAIWIVGANEECVGAQQQMHGVWDATQRRGIEAALGASDLPFAAQVVAQTSLALETYATAWTAMHTDACQATMERKEQSLRVMDLRMACLHRARMALQAATELLADPKQASPVTALDVVEALPELETCADIEALQTGVAPPVRADADAVDSARRHLARANVELAAGRPEDAQLSVQAGWAAVTDVAYPPVRIELSIVAGRALDVAGKSAEAEAMLEEGLGLAAEAGQLAAMQEAATELLWVVGCSAGRPREALDRYRFMAERFPAGPRAHANFLNALGEVLNADGQYQAAEATFRASIEEFVAAGAHEVEDTAAPRNNLANVLYAQGKLAEAEAEHRRGLAMLERERGPDDPKTAQSRNNLANVLASLGEYQEAEILHRKALRSRVAWFGLNHPEVANSHLNLASVLNGLGRYEDAETELLRARAITEPGVPNSSLLSHVDMHLFNALTGQGRYAEAGAAASDAYRRLHETLGPDHPRTLYAATLTASSARLQGRVAEAEATYRRVIDPLEAAVGPQHFNAKSTRIGLAICLAWQGKYARAETMLRGMLTDGVDPVMVLARTSLAAALDHQGKFDEGSTEHEWLRARTLKVGAPTHPRVLSMRTNFGEGLFLRGEYQRAEVELREVLALRVVEQGTTHPDVAASRVLLGDVLVALGQHDEAEAEYRRALDAQEAALGQDHPAVAVARGRLAEQFLRRGRADEALELVDRAWCSPLREELAPAEQARLAFVVARAQWSAKAKAADRARAIGMGVEAVLAYEMAGSTADEDAESARAWLRERGVAQGRDAPAHQSWICPAFPTPSHLR